MGYKFINKPFVWTAQGTDPTRYESEFGLKGGMALPASFVNQQWSKTYNAIMEIQTVIESGKLGDDGFFSNSLNVGAEHIVSGNAYVVFGYANQADTLNTVIGKHSKKPAAASSASNTGDLFVIGNGVDGGARSNAFRITAAGEVLGTQAYAATGADYAEVYEWLDGNPDNEDRRGLIVTLDGEKIRPATAQDDYVLGVISAVPTVIGDAFTDEWHGKYVTDVFGARIMENGAWKLSEDFDESKDETYVSRLERPEWGVVGRYGKLVVVDDGTCVVNGYCRPSVNGIATTANTGYRVMRRIDENHVRITI